MTTPRYKPAATRTSGLNLRLVMTRPWIWVAAAVLVSAALYLSTVQTQINSSNGPYGADIGEIQNALPRWGLIHRSGYPLYTALGSTFVTFLRTMRIEPAAGASLFSTVWGVITVGLLVMLALELGASGPAATLGAVIGGVATSVWTFSSVAELHMMTMALSFGTLIFALRYGRTGSRRDLLLLTFCFTQGVVHQRSVIGLAPAVLVLLWPGWRGIVRAWLPMFGVAILAPLTYLYLPLRVWMGATWFFGAPGTWDGFWTLVLDNRAERIVRLSGSTQQWQTRLQASLNNLTGELFWPLLIIGLLGLAIVVALRSRREALGMTLAWLPYLALTIVVWEGRVNDAQLASLLPIPLLAGIGLALIVTQLRMRSAPLGVGAAAVLMLTLAGWVWTTRPTVLAVTRDTSVATVLDIAEEVAPPEDGQPTVLTAPWGRDFWAMAYVQAFKGQLPGLTLVDHNANFGAFVNENERVLTLANSFYSLPLTWWEEHIGAEVYLASAAPGIVEVSDEPPIQDNEVPASLNFDLHNGIRIRTASLQWDDEGQLVLTVYWQSEKKISDDYSVAVHLLAKDPPTGPDDILAQADAASPIEGWYPTSRWQPGEIVRDIYAITVPDGSQPQAVRVSLYRRDDQGNFINSPWLSLSLPAR